VALFVFEHNLLVYIKLLAFVSQAP